MEPHVLIVIDDVVVNRLVGALADLVIDGNESAFEVDADSPVAIGWKLVDGAFAPPGPPAPVEPDETLANYAARRRWELETGGIDFGGARVLTDRVSQGLVDRAVALVGASPGKPTRFKSTAGFISLADDQIRALGLAVGEHVRTLFNREGAVEDGIADGSITTREQVDAILSGATS